MFAEIPLTGSLSELKSQNNENISNHKNQSTISALGYELRGIQTFNDSMCVSVARLCQTLCDPVDYSLPGSSIHGILLARILICGLHFLFQGFFPTQGSNPHLPCLLNWQMSSLPPGPPGSPSDFWYLHNFQLC